MKSLIGSVIGGARNKTPISYVPDVLLSWMGFPDRGDFERQMKAYGSVGTLFAIVNRTSNATSLVDWRMFRQTTTQRRLTATGEEETRTEIRRHPALDLWNDPNRFFTRQELVETVQQHIDLTGEGYIVLAKEPVTGLPFEMWPVRPDRMVPIAHPTEYLTGWWYIGPAGEKIPLKVDEVLQFRMPNPLDPYRGLGPVQAALVDLDSARFSAEWNRNFFLNSAEPGGIIEVDEELDDTEFQKMLTRWREQHQGVHAAHRVAILEKGRWVDRKYSMKDMQFAELRKLSSDLIMEAFGIHAHMLGKSENVNKANAEAGEILFSRWLVVPRVNRFKQKLNHQLLPMYKGLATDREFDHTRVVPEDREADDRERTSKAQSVQLLTTAGYDPAGTLSAFGLPDIPWVGIPEGASRSSSTDGRATQDQNQEPDREGQLTSP